LSPEQHFTYKYRSKTQNRGGNFAICGRQHKKRKTLKILNFTLLPHRKVAASPSLRIFFFSLNQPQPISPSPLKNSHPSGRFLLQPKPEKPRQPPLRSLVLLSAKNKPNSAPWSWFFFSRPRDKPSSLSRKPPFQPQDSPLISILAVPFQHQTFPLWQHR